MQIATKTGKVETGKWYDITFEQDGDKLKAWLNDELIFDTKLQQNTTPGIFSTATLDELQGDVIVKIANTSEENTTCQIDLDGYQVKQGEVIRLSSAKGIHENSIDTPTLVVPMSETVSPHHDKLQLTIPAFSLNIVRLKR